MRGHATWEGLGDQRPATGGVLRPVAICASLKGAIANGIDRGGGLHFDDDREENAGCGSCTAICQCGGFGGGTASTDGGDGCQAIGARV